MRNSRERVKILLFSSYDDQATNDSLVRMFARAAKLEQSQIVLHHVGQRAPEPSVLAGFDAVFIGGSMYSVFEDVPNQDALIATVLAAREKKVPVLGICYGAQLLAKAFGGEVVRDNANSEWGTFDVETSDDSFGDILFADAPFTFAAMQAHQDRISKAPSSAMVLASSKKCAVQAFVIPGTDIYGMQFHPERTKADYEERLAIRDKDYAGDDATPDQIRATLKETPEAEALVAKFVERIIMQRK